MPIIAIKGRPRTGKSLLMTRLGFENYKNGHKVFSNYSVIYGKKVTIETMLTMPFQIVDRDFKTLLVQEADKIFDSSKPTSEVNRLLRSLVGQSGKRNLSIFYDTQYLNKVSRDLTTLTEMVIVSSVYVNSGNKEPICFEYEFYEFDGTNLTEYLGMKRFPVNEMKIYFMMYDTFEPTAPIWNYEEQKMSLDDKIVEMQASSKKQIQEDKELSDEELEQKYNIKIKKKITSESEYTDDLIKKVVE